MMNYLDDKPRRVMNNWFTQNAETLNIWETWFRMMANVVLCVKNASLKIQILVEFGFLSKIQKLRRDFLQYHKWTYNHTKPSWTGAQLKNHRISLLNNYDTNIFPKRRPLNTTDLTQQENLLKSTLYTKNPTTFN